MDANKIRNNTKILVDGEPYAVVEYMLRPNSRGAAKMVTKLRNLLTGATVDRTFSSGDNLDSADITYSNAQFLYQSGDDFAFMDNDSFEQFEFTSDKIGSMSSYLVEGLDVMIMKWNDNPINIELPPSVVLEVAEVDPGVRGDTATGGTKPATMETGVVVRVPLFVKVGEKLVITTENGSYKERAKGV